MGLKAGEKAPEFKMFNTEKKEISLSELRGKKVVLLFFPLAFTSTCTTELCSVRDSIAQYNDVNAVVLGVSVDSLFSLKKFKEEQKLNFDLLSDFNKEYSQAYDCLYTQFGFNMKGVSKRAAYVIDSSGILRHQEILENASEIPDFNKIKESLSSIS